MATSRVQRWGVFLSGYNYEIKYIKRKNNNIADGLSRLAMDTNNQQWNHLEDKNEILI